MRCAGIDLSQKFLDVHLPESGYIRLDNDAAGLTRLAKRLLDEAAEAVVLEASGGLEGPVADRLVAEGLQVYCVNPRRIRLYAQAIGRLEKTDRVDAEVLAHFGPNAAEHCPCWTPPSETLRRLRALVTRRRQLVQMRADELRRKRSAGQAAHGTYQRLLDSLKEMVAELDAAIAEELDKPELSAKSKRLQSVPGVGPVLAAVLIALLPELGQLSSKKAAKLVGVAPLADDSGQSSRPRRTRGGRAEVRQVLYMATLPASRFNPFIRDFRQRLLDKGKHKKVVHVACMNKLIRLLNAMERDELTWQQTHAAAVA